MNIYVQMPLGCPGLLLTKVNECEYIPAITYEHVVLYLLKSKKGSLIHLTFYSYLIQSSLSHL